VNTVTLHTDNTVPPDNHAAMLVDHQYLQLLTIPSHSVETVVSNATSLAEGARIFNVPTLFTTAFAERQATSVELRTAHPEQRPIDRFGLNAWSTTRCRYEDQRWRRFKACRAGVCAMTGSLTAAGADAFRPVPARRNPANAETMILARALQCPGAADSDGDAG
jgi:nicotinamidase-related amidase